MRALRVVLVTGLVLCMCAAARGGVSESASTNASAWTGTDSTRSYHSLFARILNMVRREEGGGADGELAQAAAEKERKQQHQQQKTKSGDQILEIFPRDLRKKEKFLKHLTGPLYFSPKCRKHVYRLYHNTRDCTIPAYYRRCARLLTRLAGSPRCLES
ncbi:ALK and LTK ligand 2a-like [Neoarius graeffei]|uniref:ALK and LTK ligand 2a-like n=1 Tax=Neoarius graeffei TaxID=443677 RepID=UPI00298C265D|nr:ALK and LTK ligand 2a-like [Neoarius graeffei]XP_060793021.1 ALK and LTK ligand 2a-like [Neoarius graeffei]